MDESDFKTASTYYKKASISQFKKVTFLYLLWYNLFKQSRMLMVIDYYPLVRLDRGQRSA